MIFTNVDLDGPTCIQKCESSLQVAIGLKKEKPKEFKFEI
jgi:hypothetical protein